MSDTLLSVDGTNAMYRAQYAIRPMKDRKGRPTNAVVGFFSILLKNIRDIQAGHCVVTFDRHGKNFRHELHPEYKATRDKNPEIVAAIDAQIPIVIKLLQAYGICVVGKIGIEGDDIIGGIAVNHDGPAYILSSDKDFAALLVHKHVKLINPSKGIITRKNCKDVFGIEAKQMVDFLMIDGDKIDNIPKIPGASLKTIQKYFAEYERAEDIPLERFPKGAQKTVNIRKRLKLNRKLVTIRTDLYDASHLDTRIGDVDTKAFARICEKHGLYALRKTVLGM
jgi:DNA polymerase-1